MIIDNLSSIPTYASCLPCLDKGLAAVRSLGNNPAAGRYEFEGGYFMVQEGQTRGMNDGDFEAHLKYIDVQILLEGGETVGWEAVDGLKASTEYDPNRDIRFYSGEPHQVNRLTAGMFWAAFPQDAHKACRHLPGTAGEAYKKIVMKLPVQTV